MLSRVILLAAFTVACACSTNTISGLPQFDFFSDEDEREAGKILFHRIETDLGFVEDAELQAYVERVMKRVAFASPRQDVALRVEILNTDRPNAFALPGGYIFVSRGLLALMRSEDELAGALAHELGHVAGKHVSARISSAVPFEIVGAVSGAVVGLVSDSAGDAVEKGENMLFSGMLLAPFSRSQELQADRFAVELASTAGYDPNGLERLLRRIDGFVETQRASWLSGHPPIPDRLDEIHDHLSDLDLPPFDDRSDGKLLTDSQFLGRLDGLLVGPDPSHGVIRPSRVLHPTLGVLVEIAPGYNAIQSGRTLILSKPPCVLTLRSLPIPGSPIAAYVGASDSYPMVLVERGDRGPYETLWARTENDRFELELFLFGDDSGTNTLSGRWPHGERETCIEAYTEMHASLRAIAPQELAEIEATRLRLVEAQANEAPSHLASRTESPWPGIRIATWNGLEIGERFPAGEQVKVPLVEQWVSP